MKFKAYFNGQILPIERIKISPFDRGLLYGDGSFESLRTYHKRPFLLKEHLKRLKSATRLLKIKIDLKEIEGAVFKLISLNDFDESYLKVLVTRGVVDSFGLDIKKVKPEPTIIIFCFPLPQMRLKPWKATISPIVKNENPLYRIKSLNYLTNIMARFDSKGEETIFTDEKGNILEGTISNIFIVKNKVLITPPLELPILPGVTRDLVLKLALELGLKVREKSFKKKALYEADEAFLTFSGNGIIPLVEVDGRSIGKHKKGSTTEALSKIFHLKSNL